MTAWSVEAHLTERLGQAITLPRCLMKSRSQSLMGRRQLISQMPVVGLLEPMSLEMSFSKENLALRLVA